MILSCRMMVEKFTSQLARECPGLEYEDIRGELWVVAMETRKKWRSGTDNGKFSSFLFQKLVWKRKDILHKQIYRKLIEQKVADWPVSISVPAVERSFDTLCRQICSHLKDEEQQFFILMINPSPSLMEAVSKRRTRCSKERILNYHYASYFGWDQHKVNLVIRKIKRAVQEVISNG